VAVLQRILIVTVAIGLIALGVQRLMRALATPEEAIQSQLEEMVEGFNETRMRSVIGGFASSYVDEGSGVERTDIMRILAHLFFTELDPETKAFRLRAELPPAELTITVDEAHPETRASATFRVVFTDTFKGETSLYWDARVTAEFLRDVDGWNITRTTQVNHGDRSRLR